MTMPVPAGDQKTPERAVGWTLARLLLLPLLLLLLCKSLKWQVASNTNR